MVHIHTEGPAFFCWIPKLFGKRVISTIHGLDWAREKWQSGLGSKFIHQGEKNAAKYADEIIVLSKGVQKYFMDTYGRETHFIPNGVNRPEVRKAKLISKNRPKTNITKDYASQIVEKQETIASLNTEIASIQKAIEEQKNTLKEKKTGLSK